jgi:hypothetical protein
MRPDIADIKRQVKNIRAEVITIKEACANEPKRFEAAEDIELALGWALARFRRLSDRQDGSDADIRIPR